MSVVLAVQTSDPNLLRCQLRRIAGAVHLSVPSANARGMGFHHGGEVLIERLPVAHLAPDLESLHAPPEADVLLFSASSLPVDLSLDENAQPFRERGWLFASAGQTLHAARVRQALSGELQSHAVQQLRGQTSAEIGFGLFLSRLRPGDGLTPEHAAQSLRAVALRSAEASGVAHTLIATNGELLVAARAGAVPLFYSLLEGLGECARCGLKSGASETNPAVVEHRRARTVVVASALTPEARGFVELKDGEALAVQSGTKLRLLPPLG